MATRNWNKYNEGRSKKVKNSCIKSGKKGLATGVASINNLFITEDSKRFENMVKEIELMR